MLVKDLLKVVLDIQYVRITSKLQTIEEGYPSDIHNTLNQKIIDIWSTSDYGLNNKDTIIIEVK